MRPGKLYLILLLVLLLLPSLACGGLGATSQQPPTRPTMEVTRVIEAVLTAMPPAQVTEGQRAALFSTPTPNPPPAAPVQTGRLWCEDCAAAGMDVNLWSNYDRTAAKVSGRLPHWTPVTVLERRRNGDPAGTVIGQPAFESNAAPNPPTASSLNQPSGIELDDILFISPEARSLGLGSALLAEVIRRQYAAGGEEGWWRVEPTNVRMLHFVAERLAPWITAQTEERHAVKQLAESEHASSPHH